MKKILLLSSVIALGTLNVEAYELKPYLGLDYVYSIADIEKDEDLNRTVWETKYNNIALDLGVKVHQNFGLEAFAQFSDKGKKSDNYAGVGFKTELNYRAYGVDAVGYLPLSNQFDLLGSIGVAYYDFDQKINVPVAGYSEKDSDSHWAVRAGIGAQYYVNENIAIRAMFRYNHLDMDGLDHIFDLSAGIRYYF